MSTQGPLITAEEFLRMDLGPGHFELIKGRLVEFPLALPEHGRIGMSTGFVLEDYGRRSGYGFALCNDTVVLTERGPDTVRGPDVCFYRQARWPREQVGRVLPPVPPDLAVEVVSRGNSAAKILAKVSEYLAVGVPAVWVVYPKGRKVQIHRPHDDGPVVLSEVDVLEDLPELPGFRRPVADLFL
jgi:Uma2 family endonuclease